VIAAHIHDALAQVRRLQTLVLDRSLFEGYSGKARLLCGALALAAALALSSRCVPPRPDAHLLGWAIALGVALVLNYGSLAWWFLFDPRVRRNPRLLKPAIDAVPALAAGAALSLSLILSAEYDLLFGVWMSLYGLAQVAYRQSLPRGIYWVGLAYLLCGSVCLLLPSISFLNPWPMAAVFFLGETAGGFILIKHENRARDA
jgi:hypothetical protein